MKHDFSIPCFNNLVKTPKHISETNSSNYKYALMKVIISIL